MFTCFKSMGMTTEVEFTLHSFRRNVDHIHMLWQVQCRTIFLQWVTTGTSVWMNARSNAQGLVGRFLFAAVVEDNLSRNKQWDVVSSIQDLINCCRCSGRTRGGTMTGGYRFILRHGLARERDYPEERKGDVRRGCKVCDRDVCTSIGIDGWGEVYPINVKKLKEALRKYGCLDVGVTVGREFDKYKGKGVVGKGVLFRSPDEEDKAMGIGAHYLTLVGWDVDKNNVLYWILVNSYGGDWGDNGFMYLRLADFAVFQVASYVYGAKRLGSNKRKKVLARSSCYCCSTILPATTAPLIYHCSPIPLV